MRIFIVREETSQLICTADSLVDRETVSRGSEDTVGTDERLSTGLEASSNIAAGNTLALGEVCKERKKIALKVTLVLGSNERVNGRIAIRSTEELPLRTVDGQRRKGSRARIRDRSSTAVGSNPDHDLVLVSSANRGSKPKIVGDIGNHVGSGVAPCPLCRDGLDSRDFLVDVLERNVGVALDVDVSTGPAPFGGPREGLVLDGVEGGALRTGRGLAAAPVVVVNGVSFSLEGPESITPGGSSFIKGL